MDRQQMIIAAAKRVAELEKDLQQALAELENLVGAKNSPRSEKNERAVLEMFSDERPRIRRGDFADELFLEEEEVLSALRQLILDGHVIEKGRGWYERKGAGDE